MAIMQVVEEEVIITAGKQDHDGELSYQVDYSIDDDEEVAHVVVFAQCLERVVSSVCHKVLRDVVGVKHHSQGNGPKYGADRDHCRESDHSLCEVL